jgi:hypothetical protein
VNQDGSILGVQYERRPAYVRAKDGTVVTTEAQSCCVNSQPVPMPTLTSDFIPDKGKREMDKRS